jgi:hypothetical protein
MHQGIKLLLVILISVSFNSCTGGKTSLRDKLNFHETKSIQYWGLQWKEKPFSQRLSAAPDLLIKKLLIENEMYGFKEKPIPAEPSKDFIDVLGQVELLLPEKLKELAKDRLIGVFLVDNLGGTGFADTVWDENELDKYAIIVLDRGVLQKRKANEWATWKERSIFKPDKNKQTELRVIIENDSDDTVSNAVRYILLHEIGHSLGVVSGVHSSWNASPIVSKKYPFTQLSWKMSNGNAESLFDEIMPRRRFIRPYAFEASRLSSDQIENLYAVIFDNTNFPTIHAATDIWEDFAETFVTYIHVIVEKKPYEVQINTLNDLNITYRSCWEKGTCNDKKVFMDQWVKKPLNINMK